MSKVQDKCLNHLTVCNVVVMSVCNDAADTCDSDIDSTLFVFFNGDCELLYDI